jgi:hypothetical protein
MPIGLGEAKGTINVSQFQPGSREPFIPHFDLRYIGPQSPTDIAAEPMLADARLPTVLIASPAVAVIP